MYDAYFPKDCRKCIYLIYIKGTAFCRVHNIFVKSHGGFFIALTCEHYREREVSLKRFIET
jgi:hypothetical protein